MVPIDFQLGKDIENTSFSKPNLVSGQDLSENGPSPEKKYPAYLGKGGKSEADLKAISLQPDAAQLDEMAEIIHPGTRTAVE